MSDNVYILKFLNDSFPDKLPLDYINDYELGILIGQQQLINILKNKLKISDNKEEEIR